MKAKKQILFILPAIGVAAGIAYAIYRKKNKQPSLQTAKFVDLHKYLGTWYDIAHLPAPFQEGCFNTQANYSLGDDESIKIVNTCNLDSLEGPEDRAEGIAYVVDKHTNAKLKVEFLWPFKGDYWILEVGEKYDYALVGEPSRKYLWILSRNTSLEEHIMKKLIDIANDRGFSTNNLIMTKHRL